MTVTLSRPRRSATLPDESGQRSSTTTMWSTVSGIERMTSAIVPDTRYEGITTAVLSAATGNIPALTEGFSPCPVSWRTHESNNCAQALSYRLCAVDDGSGRSLVPVAGDAEPVELH